VNKNDKPAKKSDKELLTLIEEKIQRGNYLFLPHAKKRQKDRNISDTDVLDILENKAKHKRQRNKRKDSYTEGFIDWNYCIEGLDLDKNKIRIIVSFEKESDLLIVTVIRLDNWSNEND
jgi:hypothetical protein